MRNLKLLSGILLITLISLLFISAKQNRLKKEPVILSRSGTAIIMTGAAARIPQEAGLLEELYNRGLLKDVVFISGGKNGQIDHPAPV
jgi:hypothetical protein